MRNLLIVISLLLIIGSGSAKAENVQINGVMGNTVIIGNTIYHEGELLDNRKIVDIGEENMIVKGEKGELQTIYYSFLKAEVNTKVRGVKSFVNEFWNKIKDMFPKKKVEVKKERIAIREEIIAVANKSYGETDINKSITIAQEALPICRTEEEIKYLNDLIKQKREQLLVHNEKIRHEEDRKILAERNSLPTPSHSSTSYSLPNQPPVAKKASYNKTAQTLADINGIPERLATRASNEQERKDFMNLKGAYVDEKEGEIVCASSKGCDGITPK